MGNLFEAIASGDLGAITHLLQTENLKELAMAFEYSSLAESPLHQAVATGNIEIVKLVLDHGGQELFLNTYDDLSCTPLMVAVREHFIPIIKLLLEYGADVNRHNEAMIGDTALAQAVDDGQVEIVQLLLAHRADPDILGWMQLTARHRAQKNYEANPKHIAARRIWEELQSAR